MKRAYALLSAALTTLQIAGQSPPVKVALRSSWPAPPFLAEILETVSLENPEAFFNYLDQLTDPQLLAAAATATPEAIHQGALAIAVDYGTLQEPESLAAVQMNLAMHAATPKLEAFYNYYVDNHNESVGDQCGSWVDWYGEVVCDVERLAQLAGTEAIEASIDMPVQPRPKILTFDHITPPPNRVIERPLRSAILYGSLASANFRELHSYLLSLVSRPEPHVEYIFRHVPPSKVSSNRNYLSGYGVALDLKKTDYLAVDDRHSNSEGSNAANTKETQEQRVDPVLPLILSHPENMTAPDSTVPLTAEELQELGTQAAQLIAESSDPLLTLTHLSQNFPKYAASLARRVVANQSITDELHDNSLRAQRGVNVFWLNGLQVDQKDVHPFGLLRLLKKDRDILKSLTLQGLSSAQAFELLTHPDVAAAQKGNAVLDTLFDASDRPEGGDVIVWWNDMENDNRYKRWNPSIYGILRPMYPGMLPSIKANLFNVVLTLDLSKMSSLNFLAGPMSNIINREFPLRFGLVPLGDDEAGKKMVRLFYYLIRNHGRKTTLEFLKAISQVQVPAGEGTETVQWDKVDSAWDYLVEKTQQEKPEFDFPELASVLSGEFASPAPFDKIAEYTERLGCGLDSSPTGHAFFNGKHFDVNDEFLTHLQNEMSVQMRMFQEKVYEGSLSDENKPESMSNYFYDLPTTNKRRNRYIYPSPGGLRIVNLPEVFAKSSFRASPPTYLYPSGWESVSESLYIIADLDSEAGLKLVKEALLSLTPESKTRVSLIHNPTILKSANEPRPAVSWLVAHMHIRGLLSKADPATFLSALVGDVPAAPLDGPQIPVGKKTAFEILTDGVDLKDIKLEEYADYVKQSRLVSRALQILPGQSALVVNGRVVGPVEGDFRVADFKALEDYEFRKRTEPVLQALQSVAAVILEDKYVAADIVSLATSVVASSQQPDPSEIGLFDAPLRPRSRGYDLLLREYTVFESGNKATALHRIAVLVDPLSETAQKWSSLLKVCFSVAGMAL
ncbi:hypothetical protein NLJ89_g7601 [Agrocybe chaxingu]|uniref:UDP-glucose:glycoprotein glucosyltransferase n=1 Tax=Agrocybe chaxingu TaxID=84603 RepID=A0A9W8JW21_9AGAR|nr:hypothetical protein NLJ89_g7601 [Agrocybe chaxingu]